MVSRIRQRTLQIKTLLIDGHDPFGKIVGGDYFSADVPVDSCCLVSYCLVLQTIFMTLEQLKACKGKSS